MKAFKFIVNFISIIIVIISLPVALFLIVLQTGLDLARMLTNIVNELNSK